jgi:hypothetical protein
LLEYSQGRNFMNQVIIVAVLAATGMAVAAAWAQTPPFENHRYFTMPLEKDP